ncbi:MAG: ABC-type transport auxiliary lipoprotein family protein [Gallionella sp.]|nr:ABC-type transport auxiliary lipoprotein family protein [Gallionella sp.]
MKRGTLLLPCFILPGLMLAGCAPTPRDITMYGLASARPAPGLPVSLLLAPVDAAPVYLSKDLLYRLGFADNQLHPYSNSSWNAPPVTLFATVLRQTAGGNLLTLDQSFQTARCALHIELTGFEQVFTDAQHSHAEIGMDFSLMQLRNRRELARSKLRFEVPAQSADARGGAMALEQASHQAASRIVAWLNQSLASADHSMRSACER